ncbi:PIN domain-containing protein [Pectobacterium actinidiae]|uniref:PIN domain-containing protein n=1 Tax=Pectobacterium actinidiae TaxID=1507808 RepID=UPI002A81648E|nr:PIN domain-containing protein [Pectobacterium actinidiae]MDY4315345.1 PIN domain-containing protein [Pectobacterium actinidiae]
MTKPDLDYGAICIDNSSLKILGYKFEEGLLFQLRQFKNSSIKLIQPDVIHKEIIKHLSSPIHELDKNIDKIIKDLNRLVGADIDTVTSIVSELKKFTNAELIIKERVNKFYEEVNGEVLKCSEHLDVNLLLDMYFDIDAPFEDNKEKRKEFPDAIALLSLESWASDQGFKVIIVSNDKGWMDYAENSDNLVFFKELPDALAEIQPHAEAQKIIKMLMESDFIIDSNKLIDDISEVIEDKVNGADPWELSIDATSSQYYEYDDVTVEYTSCDVLVKKESKDTPIKIIKINSSEIVLNLTIKIFCNVSASFDFSVKDGIDRDYVSVGSTRETVSADFITDAILTISGDFSAGVEALSVDNVELQGFLYSVDFGYIEPSYGEYFDYEEESEQLG